VKSKAAGSLLRQRISFVVDNTARKKKVAVKVCLSADVIQKADRQHQPGKLDALTSFRMAIKPARLPTPAKLTAFRWLAGARVGQVTGDSERGPWKATHIIGVLVIAGRRQNGPAESIKSG
jgi:hypothetical protein